MQPSFVSSMLKLCSVRFSLPTAAARVRACLHTAQPKPRKSCNLPYQLRPRRNNGGVVHTPPCFVTFLLGLTLFDTDIVFNRPNPLHFFSDGFRSLLLFGIVHETTELDDPAVTRDVDIV